MVEDKKESNKFLGSLNLVLLTFIFVSGLWAIDIGASAMIVGAEVQGLTGIRSGNTQYHLGLALVGLSFLIAGFMYLKELFLSKI